MPKTTLKVRSKQWDLFNRECKAMSLRRDDLIDRVLRGEISMLEAMPPCDAVGAKWIKDRWVTNWGGTDLEMVSAPVMLSDETLDHLNRSCAEKKVPRDAFFDCFLQFLTGRLADAALVIKDPRTKRDIGAQIVSVMHDDDLTDSEAKGFLFDIAKEWMGGRATGHWGKSMYQDRLCYDQSRVESEQLMFEEFSVGTL